MGKTKEKTVNLTEGSVAGGLWAFTLPLMLGQLLQQLYNVADAWVIGNYADNASFAAVSAGGSLTFLVVGFFNGISIGGGVVISRYFGAEDHQNVSKAIHTNVLFGGGSQYSGYDCHGDLHTGDSGMDADPGECTALFYYIFSHLFCRDLYDHFI